MDCNDGASLRIPPPLEVQSSARQAVLDAATPLLTRRHEIAERLAEGPLPHATVVGVGHVGINRWLLEHGHEWHELLTTRPFCTGAWLRVSMPSNRHFLAGGAQMISLFDYDGLDVAGRVLLANEKVGDYRFGICPIQMKIIDRTFVILQGPDVDGESSVMTVTDPRCLKAAWDYWKAALATAIPAELARVPKSLTPRQQQITSLLAADLGDDAIATALGVSVRTVRSDVAAVMDQLGVRSRFAAGVRVGRQGPRLEA